MTDDDRDDASDDTGEGFDFDNATDRTGAADTADTTDPASATESADTTTADPTDGGVDGATGDFRGDFESSLALREETALEHPVETVEDPIETVRREILDSVLDFFDGAAAGTAEWQAERRPLVTPEDELPSEEFVDERWFNFDYLREYELVDWKWVNRPYSYVSILYDRDEKTYRYHVTEPVLGQFEQYVREDLTRVIRNSLMYEDIEKGAARDAVFAKQVADTIAEHAATVEPGTVQKLYYYFMRDFLDFGRIDALMRDDGIEDVSCDGVGVPVFVYHRRPAKTTIQKTIP